MNFEKAKAKELPNLFKGVDITFDKEGESIKNITLTDKENPKNILRVSSIYGIDLFTLAKPKDSY